MELQVLAISDTHLGEDHSLLSFPHGRRHLWKILRLVFGSDITCIGTPDPHSQGNRFKVDELILLGDIADRTLSSTSQVIANTNAFCSMLASAAQVKKLIYLPGNHDHTLWTDYITQKEENTCRYSGDHTLLKMNNGKFDQDPDAASLLEIFLGYPDGAPYRDLIKMQQDFSFEFRMVNPFYVKEIENDQKENRTYIFTHGTHFRFFVSQPKQLKESILKNRLIRRLIKWLSGLIIKPGSKDITTVQTLDELEEAATPFVDSLWPSPKSESTGKPDQLWYFYTKIRHRNDRQKKTKSQLYSLKELQNDTGSIAQLTPASESIVRLKNILLKPLGDLLSNPEKKKITFVYGDTHDGGFANNIAMGPPEQPWSMRVFNTGAWITHTKDFHPSSHIFAIDKDGNEYLLDVSFNSVKIDGQPIYVLASQEMEHKLTRADRWAKFVIKLIPQKDGGCISRSFYRMLQWIIK